METSADIEYEEESEEAMTSSDSQIKSFDSCRACLRKTSTDEGSRHLFHTRKKLADAVVSCADMLSACAPYTVNESDGFPKNICLKCYKKLCSAYKFRVLCETSYVKFTNYTCELKLKNIKNEKQKRSSLNTDVKNESNIDDSSDQLKSETNIFSNNDSNILKTEDNINTTLDDNDSVYNNKYSEGESDSENKRKQGKKKLKRTIKVSNRSNKKRRSKSLVCSWCPKIFKWKHLLLSHQDSHFGIKRYFCEICQKSYRNEKDHKNFHRRGFKFQCDTCAKCFNTKAKLSIHKETHMTKREKFFCNIDGCKKTFLSLNGLDRHKVSHTGLKDFICQMCSKSFIDKYQLDIHIKIHTNDRNYACKYCTKKFITTSARTSHERWHTQTKNYICQHCQKAFVSSSGLKRHMLCHTKEQRQECRFCGKKFARFDNKKRHEMATHHFTEKSTSSDISLVFDQ